MILAPGSAHRSITVIIPAATAATLHALNTAFDEDVDLVQMLTRLSVDAHMAVPSYLGLSVHLAGSGTQLNLTVLDDGVRAPDIATSVLIPLTDIGAGRGATDSMIFYAAVPGAFVDLAADLAWLTGRELTAFTLDRHLALPAPGPPSAGAVAQSHVNQAIGVLIGCGHTPEEADQVITQRAEHDKVQRHIAAANILKDLVQDSSGRELD
jgi:hypothetical protein